jgi:hypothetical protein
MAQSIKGVQAAMSELRTKGRAPEGFSIFAQAVGLDMERAKYDTYYVMQKAREFAQANKDNPALRNQILKPLLGSDSVLRVLSTSKMDLNKIRPTDYFTDKERDRLAEISDGYQRLWHSIRMFGDRFIIKFGFEGLSALQNAFTLTKDLITGVGTLIKDFPVLGRVIAAAGVVAMAKWKPFILVVTTLITAMSEFQKLREGKENVYSDMAKDLKMLGGYLFGPDKADLFNWQNNAKSKAEREGWFPPMAPGISPQQLVPQAAGAPNAFNTTVNIEGVDVNNADQIAEITARAVNDVYRSKFQLGVVS